MKTTKITMMLLVALLAVSCSDDESVSPPSSKVNFSNEIDQDRLSQIAPYSSVWSRGAAISSYVGDVIESNYPAVPGTVTDLSAQGTSYSAVSADEVLHIPSGQTFSGDVGFFWSGTTLYVEGDLVINSSWGLATIYVLRGGSVTFPEGTLSETTVYSWGNLYFSGDFTLNSNSYLYSYDGDIDLKGYTMQINSSFESKGSVVADKIEIVGASAWEASRTVKFGGCVTVDTFDVSNYASVYLSSAGLIADDVDLHSYSTIFMTESTLVQIKDELNFENRSCFSNLSSEYAVIFVASAGEITIDENSYLARVNGGPVLVDYTTLVDDNSGNAIDWAANVIFNSEGIYIAPVGDCHTGYGEQTGTKEPVLEHDAVVTSPDIERISATSIDFSNGLVFVSWHEAEANYQGYIDVVNMSNMLITATLYTDAYDFNHMYINRDVAYVTGGKKSGAFYAEVLYATGNSSVGVEIKKINGASGNCITIDNSADNKWVVSGAQGGITIADENDEQSYEALAAAKFVEPYNGGMAVLAGISPAVIYEYGLDGEFSNSYQVGAISPDDGKNTLHADGADIYACLGKGGLVLCTGGVKDAKVLDSGLIGSVNCVDTDNDYIYIANGTKGLTIIKKSDWSEVKTYSLGDASANYVKLGEDGYIYVAYGLKGVHRFKLVV